MGEEVPEPWERDDYEDNYEEEQEEEDFEDYNDTGSESSVSSVDSGVHPKTPRKRKEPKPFPRYTQVFKEILQEEEYFSE